MDNIYGKLYEITNQNMKPDGELVFKKGTFVSLTNQNPRFVDFMSLIELDNEDFLEASYMSYFNRLPDDNAINHWNKLFDLDKNEFQKKVTQSLTGSIEFRIKDVNLINNIYIGDSVLLIKLNNSIQFNSLIRKIYVVYLVRVRPLKIKIQEIIYGK